MSEEFKTVANKALALKNGEELSFKRAKGIVAVKKHNPQRKPFSSPTGRQQPFLSDVHSATKIESLSVFQGGKRIEQES